MRKVALFAIAFLAGLVFSACAETWPSLENYVKACRLIVLCNTEIVEGQAQYKVEEVWKGQFNPEDFNEPLRKRIPKAGYLPRGLTLHSGRKPFDGQKAVFFFTHFDKEGKYSGSSTSFDVNNGKLVYAETSESGLAKEYTLGEFKKAVLSFVESEKKGEPPAGGDAEDRAPQP